MTDKNATAGHIQIKGPFPGVNPILYPNGRHTPSYVYQVFNDKGGKMHGGSSGSDLDATIAYTKGLALAKGFSNPSIDIIPGDANGR